MDQKAFSDLYRRLVRTLRPPPEEARAARLRVFEALDALPNCSDRRENDELQ